MKRVIGFFLTFLGFLLLLKSIKPEVYLIFLQYGEYFKRAFWGVVLIVAGIYLLTRNKIIRMIITAIFVLYLTIIILLWFL
ncbi:hypothetical protein PNA2_0439 [Pyrococcus sp. NA2]|uniref:hypothetical protein n=1 Tax=Pyrococcus sp. (strain NA2) TaxID=342949 RepID=UPI000209AA43|nr:hypothetical protein [Pyrococcus sp. NA2]AEC51356.1 hypothetical protein PNA2_0439 [Pyrococcus sp. NA2]